jgi:hypothetical protein
MAASLEAQKTNLSQCAQRYCMKAVKVQFADPGDWGVKGVGLQSVVSWGYGFDFRSEHGGSCTVFVVCCTIGQSLVQDSATGLERVRVRVCVCVCVCEWPKSQNETCLGVGLGCCVTKSIIPLILIFDATVFRSQCVQPSANTGQYQKIGRVVGLGADIDISSKNRYLPLSGIESRLTSQSSQSIVTIQDDMFEHLI